MKKLILALMLACTPAFAQDSIWEEGFWGSERTQAVPPGITLQKMARLSSDRDAKTVDLNVMLSKEGLVQGLFGQASTGEGRPFWIRDIDSAAGATLLELHGRKVLILKGKLNRNSQEGRFRIQYLTNGVSMRYESCDFLLKENGGKFFVQNAYTGRRITAVKAITHSLGVTTLEGLCPAY